MSPGKIARICIEPAKQPVSKFYRLRPASHRNYSSQEKPGNNKNSATCATSVTGVNNAIDPIGSRTYISFGNTSGGRFRVPTSITVDGITCPDYSVLTST